VLAYPRDTVIAEKLEAIVVLGVRNSRIKDFFDLYHLAGHFTFDRATLTEAVRRTFARRQTPIPEQTPLGLTRSYWEDPARPPQVKAFAKRAGLDMPGEFAGEIVILLGAFLLPILEDLRSDRTSAGTWNPGGPWQLTGEARP
jgi:Nucleotidyl transferase AbiEii toxin, Type IV TA system